MLLSGLGIGDDQQVADQSVCQPLYCKGDVGVAGYVDNFAAPGPSEELVSDTRDKIRDVLVKDFHLPVHAEEYASPLVVALVWS